MNQALGVTFTGFCRVCLLLMAIVVVSGCETSADDASESMLLPIDLDKPGAEELLRYYFGAYASEEGADPFAAGVLDERDGAFYVDLGTLALLNAAAADSLRAVSGEELGWEELKQFVRATYYRARGLPPTLAALQQQTQYDDETWFTVDVRGVMTTARRRIYVSQEALRAALTTYHNRGEQLVYPIGTTFVGEHFIDSVHVETTVMRKRADDYWDYFIYNREGDLARETGTPPRSLESPIQCVGCHLGDRQFEPEESFPAEAPAGPHGPRAIYVGDNLRDMQVVRFFQEHLKRSDNVLGLYGTLFVSTLRARQRAGSIAPEDSILLAELGL